MNPQDKHLSEHSVIKWWKKTYFPMHPAFGPSLPVQMCWCTTELYRQKLQCLLNKTGAVCKRGKNCCYIHRNYNLSQQNGRITDELWRWTGITATTVRKGDIYAWAEVEKKPMNLSYVMHFSFSVKLLAFLCFSEGFLCLTPEQNLVHKKKRKANLQWFPTMTKTGLILKACFKIK